MFIHWFPGHMTKAIRMMKQEVAVVDSIIYVLDARAPLSCINEAFEEVIANKPRIYVLNKCDLADSDELAQWVKYFKKLAPCIAADSLTRADTRELLASLTELNAPLIQKYKAKGVARTIRAMVIGVPNSGKSTLINSLTKGKKTITGNRPGVTRGKQWVSIGKHIDLLDSPGVLFPDFKDQQKAVRLAIIGSIKDDILDITELGLEAVKFLMQNYPQRLQERYCAQFSEETPAIDVMNTVAAKRGFLQKDGDTDYEKTGRAIITDIRKGYLGKLVLEKVSDGSFIL
ncbi:MAG: ribosome biogenesis GTPase YlqF [Clostridia bacterium]|nr:ribosome biogenesis GTPase YlqF [Clostridia bacterium]